MTGMWTLIRNGGVIPMSFILVFGLLALGAAFYFAVRPQKESLGFISSMSRATLFGTLAATAADVGTTLNVVSQLWEGPNGAPVNAAHVLIEGFAESTSPCILGFTVLALVSMLTAVGRRRLDGRSEVG